MAAIQLVKILTSYGDAQKIAVYLLKNVTTNDTYNFNADFTDIVSNQYVGASANAGTWAIATKSGTVLTFALAGYSGDAIYAVLFGAGA